MNWRPRAYVYTFCYVEVGKCEIEMFHGIENCDFLRKFRIYFYLPYDFFKGNNIGVVHIKKNTNLSNKHETKSSTRRG